MNPTELNTQALNLNNILIIASILATLIGMLWGYKKYSKKNIIKKTTNKKGNITQSNKDNIIDDVDNESGTIIQK